MRGEEHGEKKTTDFPVWALKSMYSAWRSRPDGPLTLGRSIVKLITGQVGTNSQDPWWSKADTSGDA